MSLKSMIHWNGNQMAAVDVETTGLVAGFHEIVELAIIPLDSNLNPNETHYFHTFIRPEFEERISEEAMNRNKLKLPDLIRRGVPRGLVPELFESWYKELNLPYGKSGKFQCRLIPLAHNAVFDIPFLKALFGQSFYEDHFHYHYADSMIAARYLCDRAGMKGEKVPFKKLNLEWLAKELGVKHDRPHSALSDAYTTALVYQKLAQRGLLL